MKAEEILKIGQNQERRQVFFHTKDGKTIVRTMETNEIAEGGRIRNQQGEQARIAYLVELFNEKYSQPQVAMQQHEPSQRMQVLLEREAMLKGMPDVPMTEDDIEELRKVREEIDYLMQTEG